MDRFDRLDVRLDYSDKIDEARAIFDRHAPALDEQEGRHFDQLMLETSELQAKLPNANPYKAEYDGRFWRYHGGAHLGDPTEARALASSLDTGGGFTCPDDFSFDVQQAIDNIAKIRSYFTILPAGSTPKSLPIVTDTGASEWVAEGASFSTANDPTFGIRNFGAHKLGRLVKVSTELAQDGGALLQRTLRDQFGRSQAIAQETAFIAGTGAGQPRGLILDASLGVTAASATAISSDEVIRLQASLKPVYRRNAKWLCCSDTLSALCRLKSGAGAYMDLTQWINGQPIMLGSPVLVSADMPTMATGNRALLYGDLSFYTVVQRQGLFVQLLKELYAVQGFVAYLCYERLDGRLTIGEAVQALVMA
jgi:HK97 family phage major capsid protein